MPDLRKIVISITFIVSFFLIECLGISISNTVTAFIITGILWSIIFMALCVYFENYKVNRLVKEVEKRSKLHTMNIADSFPFSLHFEGVNYEGRVIPSANIDKNGVPEYFRVLIGITFFAYLCCDESGWRKKDGYGSGDTGLIHAIGEHIKAHYINKNKPRQLPGPSM